MSRVALFIDGAHHLDVVRRIHPGRTLDLERFAGWVQRHVGGSELVGAHVYTTPDDRRGVDPWLNEVEAAAGFFLHVVPPHGGFDGGSGMALVAELVQQGATGLYDTAVVVTDRPEFAAGVRSVHAVGRRAWVMAFLRGGEVADALRRAAWSTVDLSGYIEAFSSQGGHSALAASKDLPTDADVLREVRRAEEHFTSMGGFVGAHYFVKSWRGRDLPDDPAERRAACDRLIESGAIETYEVGGRLALRVVASEE